MNIPKNQFLTAPARALFHLEKGAAIGQNLTGETARAVFDWQTELHVSIESSRKFQDKVKENYEKKIQSLSAKIKELDEKNPDKPEAIKEALKKEKAQMLREAFDQTLKDLKINKPNGKPVTYLESEKEADPVISDQIKKIFDHYLTQADADISKAVDDYLLQQAIASGKIKAALTAIPTATAPLDFQSPNPEIQRLQEIRAAREKALDTGKKSRSELLQDEAMRYRATTGKIDELTSPNGGKIDDYDDGWNPLNKVTDENSPTRYRLNGYLYANYIFAGGGESGMQAVDAGIQKPYELYHSTLGDSRLTIKDLDSGMGLERYFKDVKEYSNFDKPIGVMAGIWKLIDDNIKDPTEHQRYLEYVKGKFAELKTGLAANDEEKQLELLFGIKSRAEFLKINPDWKNALNAADQMTDPDRDGAKITDYPGTFGSNKDNPTRHQLTGYLYSTYLFNGKKDAPMQSQFDRAAKIYDDSGLIDKDFTQDDLEGKPEGKKDRFGLGVYLREAATFTKNDKVKGVIAGLLKQSDGIGNAEEKDLYQKELREKFALLSKSEGEETQLMLLSTVRSPAEFSQEHREELRIGILDLMIKASQQHNQFKFSPALSADFAPNKPTLDSKTYAERSTQSRTEIENFIKKHADDAMADLRTKYKILEQNNAKLVNPLLSPADLEPLRLAVEDSDKKFNEARAVNRVSELRPAVEDKYLEKLTNAEKVYIDRVTELDGKLKDVKEAGSISTPRKTAASSPAESGTAVASGAAAIEANKSNAAEQDEEEETDHYTANWSKAERVTPALKGYTGKLITDSEKDIIAYNYKGKRIAILANDAEVIRTKADLRTKSGSIRPARRVEGLNFIRVTHEGKMMWIPEESLSKTTAENEKPKADAPKQLEKIPERQPESDKFTKAWSSAELKHANHTAGIFHTKELGKGEYTNIRNAKGEIIASVHPGTPLLRREEDTKAPRLHVLHKNFIQVRFNYQPAWVAESQLERPKS